MLKTKAKFYDSQILQYISHLLSRLNITYVAIIALLVFVYAYPGTFKLLIVSLPNFFNPLNRAAVDGLRKSGAIANLTIAREFFLVNVNTITGF